MEAEIPSLVACPHCGTRFFKEEWVSYNTFGATLWSDGVLVGPGVPSFTSPYGKCTQCGGFFSTEKSRVKGKVTEADLDSAKRLKSPSITDYFTILANDNLIPDLPKRREMKLRSLVWYACNDVVRYKQENPDLPGKAARQENMEKLAALLEDSDEPEDMLMVAELYRQLGKFSLARQTLSKVTSEEFKDTRHRIAWLCLMRRKKLAVVWAPKKKFRLFR
ncbi:MAG TPA: hypothetical protein VFE50_22845 [Cyclobacteriaceae bacterium]|nr:hypothetical protein [Cyclobacteriaceae bacterium]